jgi:SAM-dependent methyltransferase
MAGTGSVDLPEVGYGERARFYEVEYRTAVDQGLLASLVSKTAGPVLEIPCGAGRNLDWLIAAGRETVCADIEPAMVERVAERIAAVGADDRVTAVRADMRDLDLGRDFGLALVPQEAFQLVDAPGDAERALARLARHLAPGGTLMLDLHTFRAESPPGELDSPLPDYFDPTIPDGRPVTEWRRNVRPSGWLERSRRQYDEGTRVRVDYHYRLGEGERVREEWRSSVRLRRYNRREVEDLAAGVGLRITRMARDYSGAPWRPGAARMITLLRSATDHGGET